MPPVLIERRTTHPAKIVGWCKRALLVNHRRRTRHRLPGGIAEFVPANAYARSAGDRVIDHHRFVRAEISITQSIHQAVGERVETLRVFRVVECKRRHHRHELNAATPRFVGPVSVPVPAPQLTVNRQKLTALVRHAQEQIW